MDRQRPLPVSNSASTIPLVTASPRPWPEPWPEKVELFGVRLSVTDYATLTRNVMDAADRESSFVVDFISVDPLVQARGSLELQTAINTFECVCPDGHPVRVAMNHLRGTQLTDRVCGPDSMLRLVAAASERSVPVYFYGSQPETLEKLTAALTRQFPSLRVAGSYAPPFRPLTPAEEDDVTAAIAASGARLVFVGLGAPRQSLFALRFRDRLPIGWICVGAAFDFLAGTKSRAPQWMQRGGLEWLFRLASEPRRLAKRYLVRNSVFVMLYGQERWRLLWQPPARVPVAELQTVATSTNAPSPSPSPANARAGETA